ncbi:high affinity cationic amino acid transporter 1-like isoform X2 [Haemaphysalis longicornis]
MVKTTSEFNLQEPPKAGTSIFQPDGLDTSPGTSKGEDGSGDGLLREIGKHARALRDALIRKKQVGADAEASQLKRCLSTFDLTLLALCYAELGARVPRAGSAYVYSYVTVGEFMAFVIGWNLILEYVIGNASVARGYSGYLDSLVNHTIERHMQQWMPLKIAGLSSYPDLFAFGITLVLTVIVAIGVKESTSFNTVFTCVNLLVVLFVVIAGSFKADIANWRLKPEDIPGEQYGEGGFFPYGFGGVLNGAASCFYAFVGFDCIATMGEEVKKPRRAIPIGLVISLAVVCVAYFGVSIIQTLLWPYYAQNVSAPLPFVFDMVGWPVGKWVVSIGALAGLSTSLMGGMFALPRVLYAMGSDGLIFRILANVHPRLKTPLIATTLAGAFSGIMAMMFNVEELANMMSIGTLLAYSLVAVSVLMLRYDVAQEQPAASGVLGSEAKEQPEGRRGVATMLFNLDGLSIPTNATAFIVKTCTLALGVLFLLLTAVLVIAEDKLLSLAASTIGPLLLLVVVVLFCILCIVRQPRAGTDHLSFAVPLVPFIPLFNMFVNLYLMMRLPAATWARFGIWMAAGMLVYFGYGICHSSQRKPPPRIPQEVAGECAISSKDGSPSSPKH